MSSRRTFALLALCTAVALVHGHAMLTDPRQRGSLRCDRKITMVESIDEDAPWDYRPHFPAGDKESGAGGGKRSQEAQGGSYTEFKPFDKDFRWRAGVCGDTVSGGQHLKGGEYYGDGEIVKTYAAGSVVDFASTVVAHHNGFYEFYICNIDACSDDDISVGCFQNGHCRQLMRATNGLCDEKTSMECGPIDRNYPGRWYLPCGSGEGNSVSYGGDRGTMRYLIPDDLRCEHCVIMWYHAVSNSCNAVGNREYFEGPDAPNWGTCGGQGNAIGGYSEVQGPCEGRNFAEEYYQCADVSVTGSGVRSASDESVVDEQVVQEEAQAEEASVGDTAAQEEMAVEMEPPAEEEPPSEDGNAPAGPPENNLATKERFDVNAGGRACKCIQDGDRCVLSVTREDGREARFELDTSGRSCECIQGESNCVVDLAK